MLGEWHYFFENTLRWRNLRKITIAQVHGTVYAAGLMLMWACDLIVAADNAQFSDPVLFMGICGVEYHAHTWEFGARKAKELLFTGGSMTALLNKLAPAFEKKTGHKLSIHFDSTPNIIARVNNSAQFDIIQGTKGPQADQVARLKEATV